MRRAKSADNPGKSLVCARRAPVTLVCAVGLPSTLSPTPCGVEATPVRVAPITVFTPLESGNALLDAG